RRRHTSVSRDWSSDVCTSDLGYTSTKEHLSSQNQAWLNRSPEYYLERAKHKSDELYQLFELIFQQDRYPETLYRTCDGLLRLSQIVRASCRESVLFSEVE